MVQDDWALDKLHQRFQSRLKETFRIELCASGDTDTETDSHPHHPDRLKETRRRLRQFLDLRGGPAKRMKTDNMEE